MRSATVEVMRDSKQYAAPSSSSSSSSSPSSASLSSAATSSPETWPLLLPARPSLSARVVSDTLNLKGTVLSTPAQLSTEKADVFSHSPVFKNQKVTINAH